MTEFKASNIEVSKHLAGGSHLFTSFGPELRAKQELDWFTDDVQAVYDDLKRYTKSDMQRKVLVEEMVRFQSAYAEKYNALLYAMGHCFSVMITGGSRFNARKHEAANQARENRYDDLMVFKKRAIAAIKHRLKDMEIEEQGGEVQALRNKIERLEKVHESMIISNKIIRNTKLTQDEKTKAIVEVTGFYEDTVLKMFVPDCFGDIGFPKGTLGNSSAKIRANKLRLAELENKETTQSSDITFIGGKIVDNMDEDRVQIVYDDIPSEELRAKHKSEGWKWSPRNKAWQRKRTTNALNSAKRINQVKEVNNETVE